MPYTPRLGIYYPLLADDPDVPDDMRKLALSVEAASIGWSVGDFKFSFQTADHDQFILCDGNARLRAGLPAPYLAMMDSVFGVHPDPLRVYTPNFKRRSPMGADPGGSPVNGVVPNLGRIAGEERHTLSATESGVNPNGSTSPAGVHSHGYDRGIASAPNQAQAAPGGDFFWTWDHPQTDPGGSHSHPLIGRAADADHNNVQPVLFGNWFISTGGGGSGAGGGGSSGVGGPVDLVATVRQNVDHGLGVEFVSVTTWDAATGAQVDAAPEIVDLNTVSLLSASDITVNLVVIPAALPLP